MPFLQRPTLSSQQQIDLARRQVADGLEVSPSEITFTSGATESNNLLIKGLMDFFAGQKVHIITSQIEHLSVLNPLRYLEKKPLIQVTYVPCDSQGLVQADLIEKAICDQTKLVSLMFCNNEIGTLQNIRKVAQICRKHQLLLHCDAAQGLSVEEFLPRKIGIDFASLSSHKVYGPQGIGALFIKAGREKLISPLLHGGNQERNLRSGTLNTTAIIGMGKAFELVKKQKKQDRERLLDLKKHFQNRLTKELDLPFTFNGCSQNQIAQCINMTVPGIDVELLMLNMPGVIFSQSSMCLSQKKSPSYVLSCMGLDEVSIHSSLRFGLGRYTTKEQLDKVAIELIQNIKDQKK